MKGEGSGSPALSESEEIAFTTMEADGFSVGLATVPEAPLLLSALLPDPDDLLDRGEVFKPGSRTHGARVEVGAHSYFLKRYNDRGATYRLRHVLRASRALRTWHTTWEFLRRGVPVPRPLVLLEERRCGLLRRSYILMEFVAEGERLRALWRRLEAVQRRALLDAMAEVLGRLHGAGCLHGDLKWDNILVCGSPAQPEILLVDLDGSQVQGRFRRGRAEKDMTRFVQDLESEGGSGLTSSFLAGWQARLGEKP